MAGGLSRDELTELERIRTKVDEGGVGDLDASEREFLTRLRDRFSRSK